MSIFKTHQELSPLSPSDSEASQRVLRTHELLDLDDDQMILVGSAAMALYGIKLSPFDPIDINQTMTPRPSDLDFATSPLYMQTLYDPGVPLGSHVTPSGHPLHAEQLTNGLVKLRIETPELPVDLLSGFRDERDSLTRFDEAFRRYTHANSRPVEGSTLRVITPRAMRRELAKRQRVGLDPKAKSDLARLRMTQLR